MPLDFVAHFVDSVGCWLEEWATVSLEFMGWFDTLPRARELADRLFRQIDKIGPVSF